MPYTEQDVTVTDGFFPDDMLKAAFEEMNAKLGWSYGWWVTSSNDDKDEISKGHNLWRHEVLGTTDDNVSNMEQKLLNSPDAQVGGRYQYIAAMWSFLQANKFAPHRADLLRCYLVQHTYGVEGYPHRQAAGPGLHTMLVNINQMAWKPEWGGETAFFGVDNEIVKSVMPKFGRVLYFPSDMVHSIRSVTRQCNIGRKTLIFKVRETA